MTKMNRADLFTLDREERIRSFANKVEFTGDCWIWMASRNQSGYGQYYDGYVILAHRWSYHVFVGPIPEGLQIDHLCRVPACVNPDHLEPVTNQENSRRGMAGEWRRAAARQQTHCLRGHELTGENVKLVEGVYGTQRQCRLCQTIRARLRRGLPEDYRGKTHCKRGHEFTEENTYRKPSSTSRRCRTCQRAEWAAARAKQKVGA